MADDAPVRAALVASGPDRDRWREWLLAAGVQVVVCDRLAAAVSLVPRPSVVVADALAAAERSGAIDGVTTPVVLVSGEVGRAATPGPLAVLPPQVSRAALVGTVLALSAGLRVSPGPGASHDGAVGSSRPGGSRGSAGPSAGTDADETTDPWWSESPTPREREVIELAALGLTNRAIAARLGLSAHTVKFHLAAIYAKLGARGRTQAVRRAIRRGWITL